MRFQTKLAIVGGLTAFSAALVMPAFAQGPANATIAGAQEVSNTSPFTFNATTGVLQITGTTAYSYLSQIATPSTPSGSPVSANLTSFMATGGVVTEPSDGFYKVTFTSLTGSFYSADGTQDFLTFNFNSAPTTFDGVTTTTKIVLTYDAADTPGQANFNVSASESPASGANVGLNDFSSTIYNFSNPNAQNQYYTSESISTTLQNVNPSPAVDGSGNLSSFTADGSFIFSSTPGPAALPEPTSVAMGLFGAGISVLPILRRKRPK